jgi:hypothetical protein
MYIELYLYIRDLTSFDITMDFRLPDRQFRPGSLFLEVFIFSGLDPSMKLPSLLSSRLTRVFVGWLIGFTLAPAKGLFSFVYCSVCPFSSRC